MNIQIIQEDIDKGQQSTPVGCAIARAIRRQYNFDNVSVTTHSAAFGFKRYELSQDMTDFICAFDRDKALVFPTEFTIDLTKELVYA